MQIYLILLNPVDRNGVSIYSYVVDKTQAAYYDNIKDKYAAKLEDHVTVLPINKGDPLFF